MINFNQSRESFTEPLIRIVQLTLLGFLLAIFIFSFIATSVGDEQLYPIPVAIGVFVVTVGLFALTFLGRLPTFTTIATVTFGVFFTLGMSNEFPQVFLPIITIIALTVAILLRGWLYWIAISVLAIRTIVFLQFTLTVDNSPMFESPLLGSIPATVIWSFFPIVFSLTMQFFLSQFETYAAGRQRYASLLEASADIGQSMSQMLELNELLMRVTEIIRDRFAFYHVQVFLIDDERRYAYLTASTGDIGERMLARNHRLPVDSSSVVGRVSQAGDVIVAYDTDRETGHAFNELLPDTRSELGLPIMDGEGIIGVLDVQSRRPEAFSETEINVLRVIANQLATAIRNARLFESQARSVQENKRLFIDSETSLREIQRLNRQLTRQAWQDYLIGDLRVEGVTLTGQEFSNQAEWTENMRKAGQRRRPIQNAEDTKKVIAVPIELRGEVIGAIEIETESKAQDREDMMDMVNAISQRLAVSLDNARLFEETNEATAQEQRIGEIVSQYQTADTVDELLKMTLTGLAETLGADKGSIRIGAIPDEVFASPAATDDPSPSDNGNQSGETA